MNSYNSPPPSPTPPTPHLLVYEHQVGNAHQTIMIGYHGNALLYCGYCRLSCLPLVVPAEAPGGHFGSE